MTDTATNKEFYREADGSIVEYPDAYKLSESEISDAERMEQYILAEQRQIKQSFLKIGAALNIFEDQKYYLGRGFPSFRAWLNSPDIEISYRLAHDLMRISNELVPKIGMDNIEKIPVSTLREMLPMLSDGTSDEDLLELVEDVDGLTTRDAKGMIRERRGVKEGIQPVLFHATVTKGSSYHRVTITRAGEDGDVYEVTSEPLRIKPKDFALWQQRFGTFMDFNDE